jgi:hypothetical protein
MQPIAGNKDESPVSKGAFAIFGFGAPIAIEEDKRNMQRTAPLEIWNKRNRTAQLKIDRRRRRWRHYGK